MLIISTVCFLKKIFNSFIYLGISYMQTLHTTLQLSSYCFTSSNISPTLLSWPFLAVVAYIHTYVHIWIFMCINAYLCKNLLSTFGFINMFKCLRLVSMEWIAYQEDCAWRRLSLPHAAIINCCNSSSSYIVRFPYPGRSTGVNIKDMPKVKSHQDINAEIN